MKKYLILALGLVLLNFITPVVSDEDIVFNASVTHKFLFTDVGGSLVGGY